MENINYSIIIPHKNIPCLLQRCLNSIPRREDIQIIVVDDNSDEKLVNFLLFPGINEPNVEVYFTKEGKGAGHARNIGLSYAKGKWILFADADDYFSDILLETIDFYCNSIYDIVYFGVSSVYSHNLTMASRGNFINTYIKKDLQNKTTFENSRYRRYAPWAKMIKKNLIDKYSIRFEERHVSNDIWFSILTGYYAQHVYADIKTIYCLTVRDGSLEKTINKANLDERFDAACRVNTFFITKDYSKYRINLWNYSFNYLKHSRKSYFPIVKKICDAYKKDNQLNLCIIDLVESTYKVITNIWRNLVSYSHKLLTKKIQ